MQIIFAANIHFICQRIAKLEGIKNRGFVTHIKGISPAVSVIKTIPMRTFSISRNCITIIWSKSAQNYIYVLKTGRRRFVTFFWSEIAKLQCLAESNSDNRCKKSLLKMS